MLNLILDGLLLAVFAAGGWFWRRQNLRQQQLERLLADASRQLDQATQQLAEASKLLAEARQAPAPAPESEPEEKAPDALAGILALHRQGENSDAIARKLGIPAAQVRLALKLHGKADPGAPAPQARVKAGRRRSRRKSKAREEPQEKASGRAPSTDEILRRARCGQAEEDIARELGLPSAQVRLVLALHDPPPTLRDDPAAAVPP